jgi:uncharacterized oxidoreductase
MDISNVQVLITGGSEGIGLGLARRFLKAGAEVLITGRNKEKLQKAAAELPGLKTLVNDIGKPEERERLAADVGANVPTLIVNVTSGGAYIPQVFAPVYSACKAAVHSYTVTLRHALADTQCRVVELIPPAVATALAGPGNTHGASLDEFCDTVFPELTKEGATTVGYGPTQNLIPQLSGKPVEEYFEASAARFPVERYR